MNKPTSLQVAVVGNPNCGKTTLFNRITGSTLKVANWPGVTVEKMEGVAECEGYTIHLFDTPGIYALSSYTIEERVTKECITEGETDVIINVVDASNLERNLFLTLQLLELGKPLVLALNMMDVVYERGMEIDLHRLPELLSGIPVVAVTGTKGIGVRSLMHAVAHHYEEGPVITPVSYGKEIEDKLTEYLQKGQSVGEGLAQLEEQGYREEIIQKRYQYIEQVMKEVLLHGEEKKAATDRVDRVLLHPLAGIPIFLLLMLLVFAATFLLGDTLKTGLEWILSGAMERTREVLQMYQVASWLQSLLVDAIMAGVGGILTFIPNIAILFFALSLLEDSGYMARVAYIMDGVMGKVGLSGKAFLPMLLGFGCTVPAIMATRSLETQLDRRRTMLLIPYMSCSAKLPIYVLFAGMFFPDYAILVSFSMYGLGIFVGLGLAYLLHQFGKVQTTDYLLIELPDYKRPNARVVAYYVWTKVKEYLTKAGTIIFLASIVVWIILNVGPHGMTLTAEDSYGALLGKIFAPLLVPAGLDRWEIVVALFSGISAKEVVVSSMAVLFGLEIQNYWEAFGVSGALSFMVFCLLYVPCIATVVMVYRESKSFLFTCKMVLMQMGIAWLMATLVYQVAIRVFGL